MRQRRYKIRLVLTKICAKESCSSCTESDLEKQGFEAKKTEKQTFEILIGVKNSKIIFLEWLLALKKTKILLFATNLGAKKKDFFEVVRIRLKKSLWSTKKVKPNIWNIDLGEKMADFLLFFSKLPLSAKAVIFHMVPSEKYYTDILSLVLII